MINISITEDDYFLPDDGDAAKQRYLDTLAIPSKTYISCYGFTLQQAFDTIGKLDSMGFEQSLLLDYTQGMGNSAKPKIKALYPTLQHSSVVLTTAGSKSHKTRAIWHWKGMVKLDPQGGLPYCMEGSTNLSDSGFFQGNSMRFFRSKEWADAFIAQHEGVKAWAVATLPHYQPSALSEGGDFIDAYFESLAVNGDGR